MPRYAVAVAADHIESLARMKNPLLAIEELIWNSLDADATTVDVALEVSQLGALSQVRVTDNGHGITSSVCEQAFASLGGSPKLAQRMTPNGRQCHGKDGQGRYRAFGIGKTVVWVSRYRDNGQCKEFVVQGSKASICVVDATDPKPAKGKPTGVEVVIKDIEQNYPLLHKTADVVQVLSQKLALYLRKYPGIQIKYDGVAVDPAAVESHTADYPLTLTDADGTEHKAELTVIEWSVPTERALYFCDEHGFALEDRSPGIHAPGYNFTAYLKSALNRQLTESAAFGADQLHPVVASIIDVTKEALKSHFRKRDAEKAVDLVEQWKQEDVYPFNTIPTDPVGKIEQEVFNICAAKVHEYLPSFDKADATNKRLTFRLIRQALESNPPSLQTILREVLNLPQEHQNDLARLLGRTKLATIINATKTVVDRLDFLAGLDALVFGRMKRSLLERQQLQRILTQELWLFGDQYGLGVDDQGLKELLAQHIRIIGRDKIAADDGDVKDLDGKRRRLDLMLYRRFPQNTPHQFEHLIIELKRPACKLGRKEIGQIEGYAFAVRDDVRFDKRLVKWNFILIGSELDSFAESVCNNKDRKYGHIHTSESLDIYVKKWSTIKDEAKWRYEFFRDQLKIQAADSDDLEFLKARYGQHLPNSFSPSSAE